MDKMASCLEGPGPRGLRGLKDILPTEAADRRRLVQAALGHMAEAGYEEVMTPAFELYEDLARGAGLRAASEMFRFFDTDGQLLALRPEMTTPIARLVGRRMSELTGPLRLCYAADVFRETPTFMGQARQFTQLGAELLDVRGPGGDAEVLSVAAGVTEAAGVKDAVFALGRVDLIRAELARAGVGPKAVDPLLVALGAGDLVTFEARLGQETSRRASAAKVADSLARLVRLDGDEAVLGDARRLVGAAGRAILEEVGETLAEVRRRLGRLPVRLHFGLLRSFDYYTGMVFDVVAPSMGTALGGGGRYDDLAAAFGRARAAAGFALGLERLLAAAAARARPPAVLASALEWSHEPEDRHPEGCASRRHGQPA